MAFAADVIPREKFLVTLLTMCVKTLNLAMDDVIGQKDHRTTDVKDRAARISAPLRFINCGHQVHLS